MNVAEEPEMVEGLNQVSINTAPPGRSVILGLRVSITGRINQEPPAL